MVAAAEAAAAAALAGGEGALAVAERQPSIDVQEPEDEPYVPAYDYNTLDSLAAVFAGQMPWPGLEEGLPKYIGRDQMLGTLEECASHEAFELIRSVFEDLRLGKRTKCMKMVQALVRARNLLYEREHRVPSPLE